MTQYDPAQNPPPYPPPSDPLSGLVPYKNVPALVGYYLAVFSLIPCLGFPLSAVAVVLGFMGLSRANGHPESKGKAHAWVAIILGGMVLLVHLAVLVLWTIGMVYAASHAAHR